MRVQQISLKHCGLYDQVSLDLPETGLVLVTGSNGSGKSTLWEVIPQCLWDTTLRGGPLWSSNKGEVTLVVDGHRITRRAHGKVKLTIDGHAEERLTYTQKNLDALFGDFDEWRESSVLTSEQFPVLTRGTDSERTRALETMLNMAVLDEAGKTANKQLVQAQNDYSAATRDELACRMIEAKATEAAKMIDTLAGPDVGDGVEEDLRKATASLAGLQKNAEIISRRISTAEYELEQIRKKRALLANDQCPDCEREFDEHYKSTTGQDLEQQAGDIRSQLMKDRGDFEAIRTAISEEQAHKGRLQQILQSKQKQLEIRAAAKKASDALHDAVFNHRIAKDKSEMRLEEKIVAEAVAKMLSPKGARSRLLVGAAKALEKTGTAWLRRLCSDKASLTVRVVEQGDKHKVMLTVSGFGGTYGYASASAGQRRRVDLAVQLAQMQIAGAARGHQSSPLILDDVLGVLDDEGTWLAAQAFSEFAQTRCVILTAQRAAECVKAVANRHIVVENGVLR